MGSIALGCHTEKAPATTLISAVFPTKLTVKSASNCITPTLLNIPPESLTITSPVCALAPIGSQSTKSNVAEGPWSLFALYHVKSSNPAVLPVVLSV